MGLIVKRRVTLDLSRRGHQVTVPFSVGDRVAHEVIFTLRDGSELIELPPGVTAAIAIKNGYKYTDNGTGCVDACVIDHVNNTITYTPTVEALSIEGNIECTLHVFDADGAVIGAPTFIFAVSEGDNANTEMEVGVALEKSPGWDIIAETVSKAGEAATSAGEAATSAFNAAKSELAALNAASNAATSASNAAKETADALRTEFEDLSDAAEISANDARDSADAAEKSAKAASDSETEALYVLYEIEDLEEAARASAESAKGYYLWAQQEADRALEYGTNLLVQEEGPNDKKVMSQQAVTYALSGKLDSSSVKQEEGQALSHVMSQKAVTDALAKKANLEDLENIGGNSVEIVQVTGDSETAVMSQKATTDAVNKILHPTAYSGTVDPVSPAYTKIYVANGLTLKKGKSYIFRVTGITDLTTFAIYARIQQGDTALFSLNPKAGALKAATRFTATEDIDDVRISIEFSTTSKASAEWSFEEDTHFVVRQANLNDASSYFAYCNSNNKVDVELLKVSHSCDDWSIVRRYGGGRTRVGTPNEDLDATNLKYFNDHTPRFRHSIHSDTTMGIGVYFAFTANLYSASSEAIESDDLINLMGDRSSGRTPWISVNGYYVNNGEKTQVIALYFDNDSGFVMVLDDSSYLSTGLSELNISDEAVEI